MEETTVTAVTTEWQERSESITEIAAALVKAQAQIEAVKKDSANPFFKSKYADLASVRDAIREPFAANGLCVVQEPSTEDGRVCITTTLLHSSGQYIRSSLRLTPVKQDPQAIGSAITYGRRYALQAVAGVAPEDDDGNAASQGKQLPPGVKPADQVPPPAKKKSAKTEATHAAIESGSAYQYDWKLFLSETSEEGREELHVKALEAGAVHKNGTLYCAASIPELSAYCTLDPNNQAAQEAFGDDHLPDEMESFDASAAQKKLEELKAKRKGGKHDNGR